jgi:hypothetical protein
MFGMLLVSIFACLVGAQVSGSTFTQALGWPFTLTFGIVAAWMFISAHPTTYFRLYPELVLFPETRRNDALKSAISSGTSWWTRLIIAIPVCYMLLMLYITMYWRPMPTDSFLAVQLMIPVFANLPNYLQRSAIRRAMRKQLRSYGVLLCLDCGYDLKGSLASDRCSECGTLFANQPG